MSTQKIPDADEGDNAKDVLYAHEDDNAIADYPQPDDGQVNSGIGSGQLRQQPAR